MDPAKRKRLESKGWKFGSAADFLGLSPADMNYIELRLRLSDALKARRRAAQLSQKSLASTVGSSQSRVAKMESNDPTVSVDLLISALLGLGVSLSELGRIIGYKKRAPILVRSAAALPKPKLSGIKKNG